MADYNEQKKVWDWMNSIGFELEDDGLLDVEPFIDYTIGDFADLVLEYSASLESRIKELEGVLFDVSLASSTGKSLRERIEKLLTPTSEVHE